MRLSNEPKDWFSRSMPFAPYDIKEVNDNEEGNLSASRDEL